MKVFVVGARGGMCHPLHSRRPRRAPEIEGAWRLALATFVGALSALSACTLTSESFDPALVDRTQAASTPDEWGPSAAPASPPGDDGSIAAPTPRDAVDTNTETETGEGEDGSEPVRLEPSAPRDDQLGTTDTPQAAAPNADAGPVSDPRPEPNVEPDAGGPVTIAATCSTQAFGDSCYEVFGEALAWVDAQARCVAWGGQLASVESPFEDVFLGFWPGELGLTPGDGSGVWLGGTDAAFDGIFLWTDGSPVLVNGWAFGQPNDGAGVDCIEKRNDGTNRWYDQRCTDARPFLCERPL